MICVLCVVGSGCGGAVGGPAGGGCELRGRIVDASDPDRGIGGAYIYVPSPTSATRGVQGAALAAAGLAETHSSEDGAYRLTGVPSGRQSVVVTPPAGSGYSSIELSLDIPEGNNVVIDLQITLVLSTVANKVSEVVVDPATATVAPGSSVQFSATAFDASYEPADLAATWVVTGGIGTVDSNGKFTAGASAGTGSVLAFVGGKSGRATVQVSDTVPTNPVLLVTPDHLSFVTGEKSKTLSVSNMGTGSVTWSVVTDAEWLIASPATVDNTGLVTVRVDRTGLPAGQHTATVTVSGYGSNSVPVELTISPGDINVIVK
jgi:hypothetical protein